MAWQKYTFLADEYRLSVADYAAQWRTLDECLYRLCRENPKHSCRPGVNAKVFIIGLTFETGIKRQVPSKGTQASSISQVADLFYDQRNKMDQLFDRLSEISPPLTSSNLTEILEIHGLIVKLLREVTREKRSTPSFVSKYMHFHNAVVPLYDGKADAVLTSLVPKWSVKNDQVSVSNDADADYAIYARRFLTLYGRYQSLSFTARSLDYYLLWKHERGK